MEDEMPEEAAERLYHEWLESPEEEYPSTKTQRRAMKRERGRTGMIKHSEPNVRPMKLPKPTINVKG